MKAAAAALCFAVTGIDRPSGRPNDAPGPLTPGKELPAKVHGVLTIKQKSVPRVADATVTYIKLSPEQVEQQKRFGFTSDNIKVKVELLPEMPIAMDENLRFAIREGGKTVGSGVVIKILQ